MTDSKGTQVCVTGGASFIGSTLVESLLESYGSVRVVDDFSSGTRSNLAKVAEHIELVEGDLRDSEFARSALRDSDYVFHLANIHGGRGFIETHEAEISQNMVIDGNVFRSASLGEAGGICFTSSACVYPVDVQDPKSPSFQRWLTEDLIGVPGHSPANADGVYGWAKLMGEMALASSSKQYGFSAVSCRLFTVYGPRENLSHAIMALIGRALLRHDPYVIWGSGRQDRNFTYVDDIVNGLKLAASRIADGSAINIGTDEITNIADAARLACELVGFEPSRFEFDLTKPEGVTARAASVSKQEELLGWRPSVSFREGLARTIDWFGETLDLKDLEATFDSSLFTR